MSTTIKETIDGTIDSLVHMMWDNSIKENKLGRLRWHINRVVEEIDRTLKIVLK